MSGSSKSTANSINEVHKNTKFVDIVKSIINEIVEENRNSKPHQSAEKQRRLSFYSKNPASISISGYLDRILKYTHIEESTLVIALIYLDRVCENCSLLLDDSIIHRILFASIITAVKYNEDDLYTNTYYSKVGGVSARELNTLEIEFVKMLKYSLFVKNEVFDKYQAYLKQYKKIESF